MTSPAIVDSPLLKKIIDHWSMVDTDIASLEADLLRQATYQYNVTIAQQLALGGCNQASNGPDPQSQRWLEDFARDTAKGITNTYQNDLTKKVRQLKAAAPRGNRYYYLRGLETWEKERTSKKAPTIALNTMADARAYAQDRFIRENGLTKQRYAPVGPPPVCKICVRIFAKGPLPWEECQKKINFVPAHSRCPHTRAALVPKKLDCSTVWRG